MANTKTPPCSRQCGQLVWFNWNAKAGEPGRSDFGKLRPLQVSETGELLNEIHECPNSDWNRNRQSQQQQKTNGGGKVGNAQIEAVLGNTMDIIARVEKLDRKFDEVITAISKIANRGDPLNDDDGDSDRENPQPEPETT